MDKKELLRVIPYLAYQILKASGYPSTRLSYINEYLPHEHGNKYISNPNLLYEQFKHFSRFKTSTKINKNNIERIKKKIGVINSKFGYEALKLNVGRDDQYNYVTCQIQIDLYKYPEVMFNPNFIVTKELTDKIIEHYQYGKPFPKEIEDIKDFVDLNFTGYSYITTALLTKITLDMIDINNECEAAAGGDDGDGESEEQSQEGSGGKSKKFLNEGNGSSGENDYEYKEGKSNQERLKETSRATANSAGGFLDVNTFNKGDGSFIEKLYIDMNLDIIGVLDESEDMDGNPLRLLDRTRNMKTSYKLDRKGIKRVTQQTDYKIVKQLAKNYSDPTFEKKFIDKINPVREKFVINNENPAIVFILIDVSGSMNHPKKILLRNSLIFNRFQAFINKKINKLYIGGFLSTLIENTLIELKNTEDLNAWLHLGPYGGNTDIESTIIRLTHQPEYKKHVHGDIKGEILIITDGQDSIDVSRVIQVRDQNQITINSIQLCDSDTPNENLKRITNGQFFAFSV